MAVLSDNDRLAIWETFMRTPEGEFAITKQQLRAVFDAVDQWVDDNTTSFNSSIPQPQRGALTARQKAAILVYVVRRRFEVA